jgi:EpsI family protein
VQIVNDRIPIDLPGVGRPLVNHYIVAHGDARSVVLYWYQSRDRVVASEYWAKFYTMVDSLASNRSDTALVRVVVPTGPGDQATADRVAIEFAQTMFPSIRAALPR